MGLMLPGDHQGKSQIRVQITESLLGHQQCLTTGVPLNFLGLSILPGVGKLILTPHVRAVVRIK